jgi:hypothetical protein
MKPLKKQRNPVIAAGVAAGLGAIGVGIYLRSWRDGVICALISLAMSPVALHVPGGFTVVVGLLAGYAALRVSKSNAQLTASKDPGVPATS